MILKHYCSLCGIELDSSKEDEWPLDHHIIRLCNFCGNVVNEYADKMGVGLEQHGNPFSNVEKKLKEELK